jgi:hypothetical protein
MCTAQRRLDGKVPELRAAIWHCAIGEATQLGPLTFTGGSNRISQTIVQSNHVLNRKSCAKPRYQRRDPKLSILVPPLE